MKTKKIQMPEFKSEDEERAFWSNNDSTEYLDWSQADVVIIPNLKPTSKSISLRIPDYMLQTLKVIANSKNIHYHSLIKIFIEEGIRHNINKS